jgi:UDP-2,4-diacetamido-2,4,6-trideoxy-beta-L-altropyranose hydrolase
MTEHVALFRCDVSPNIGAGHAMRCLALAESLVEAGWKVAFVVNEEAISLAPSLATEAFRLRTVDPSFDEIESLRQEARGTAELLVLDHYERDANFESACRSFVRRILVLDDGTGRDHDCDILVDAAAVHPAVYAGHIPAQARALTGPDYALIRRAFLERRAEALARRDGRPVKEILVSFGATDPKNATSLALDALDRFADEITITVALYSKAPHIEEIGGRMHGRMRLALDADMPMLATQADLAIGAAGVSAYERAVLGLPSILVTLVANQTGIAGVFQGSGAAETASLEYCSSSFPTLIESLLADNSRRIRLALAAAALVDGQGAKRIVEALQ